MKPITDIGRQFRNFANIIKEFGRTANKIFPYWWIEDFHKVNNNLQNVLKRIKSGLPGWHKLGDLEEGRFYFCLYLDSLEFLCILRKLDNICIIGHNNTGLSIEKDALSVTFLSLDYEVFVHEKSDEKFYREMKAKEGLLI